MKLRIAYIVLGMLDILVPTFIIFGFNIAIYAMCLSTGIFLIVAGLYWINLVQTKGG